MSPPIKKLKSILFLFLSVLLIYLCLCMRVGFCLLTFVVIYCSYSFMLIANLFVVSSKHLEWPKLNSHMNLLKHLPSTWGSQGSVFFSSVLLLSHMSSTELIHSTSCHFSSSEDPHSIRFSLIQSFCLHLWICQLRQIS